MKRLVTLGLGTLILSGCVSVLPEPIVPDALYRFSGGSGARAGTPIELPVSLTIFEPDGSALLMGSAIVFEGADGSLTLMKQARWSDDASRMLQSLMLDRLSIRTPESKGRAVGERSGVLTSTELRWQVKDFVVRETNAVASIRVTLLNGRKREILDQFDIEKTVDYTGKAHKEGVEALSEAARLAVDTVALALPEQLAQVDPDAASRRR